MVPVPPLHIALLVLLTLPAPGCSVIAHTGQSRDSIVDLQRRREDIEVFRTSFLTLDRAFTTQTRALAEQRLSLLAQAPSSLSPSAFAVELCRIAALADNGHTQCLPTRAGRAFCLAVKAQVQIPPPWCQPKESVSEIPDFATVPIAFHPFGENFNVVAIPDKASELLGARLVAVEGRSVERIRDVLRSFSGGTPAYRDVVAAGVLSSPEQLHAVGLSRRADATRYAFITAEGRSIERTFGVPAPSAPPPAWRSLPDATSGAWAYQAPGDPFRLRDAPEIDAVVVQLRQHRDAGDRRVADFLRDAERQRADRGRSHVVLDMRFNSGGNFLLTRDFIIHWPERVPGRFVVLTSRKTQSAAITSIAYLKQAAPDRVVIVGEPVGDRLMFFSDGLPIVLPHSGRYFLPATVRMDYQDGCRKYDDCFEAVAQPGRPVAAAVVPVLGRLDRLPLSVATLEPDVPVAWTIDAWLSGRDPMMDAVPPLFK